MKKILIVTLMFFCFFSRAEDKPIDKNTIPLILLGDIKSENQWVIFKDKDNCRYIGGFEKSFPIKIIKKVCNNKVEDIEKYAVLNSATPDSNLSIIKKGSVFLLFDINSIKQKKHDSISKNIEKLSF